jgi:hypothetical protein
MISRARRVAPDLPGAAVRDDLPVVVLVDALAEVPDVAPAVLREEVVRDLGQVAAVVLVLGEHEALDAAHDSVASATARTTRTPPPLSSA